MQFRLSVIDSLRYEIYGLPVLDPLGNKTDVITKKVDSLKKLNGIMVIDLIPVLTGSSFNLIINEPDSLYAVDGMTVAEAKRIIVIKYTFDGINYFNKIDFILKLKSLRGTDLND